jgi:exopolysaccharide biosynthesis WecB/TagA/CpsF family protein
LSAALTTSRAPGAAPPDSAVATRDIGGVRIAVLDHDEALATVLDAIAQRRHLRLAFCNAHLVNLAAHDAILRRLLAGFLVLADGIGVDIGSRLLHGAPFPANLNGTDFVPALLAAAPMRLHVGLVGGRPGVADRAARRLSQDHPRHRFEVVSHGFFAAEAEPAMLRGLAANPPDILLVAFGNPRQERWIADRLSETHCAVAAGVGALFDFLAGEVARAPEAVRALRLEWLYRLWLEPGRLWRRYVLGNPAFLLRMLRLRLVARRPAP